MNDPIRIQQQPQQEWKTGFQYQIMNIWDEKQENILFIKSDAQWEGYVLKSVRK